MTTPLRRLLAAEARRQRGRRLLAGGSAAAVAAASVLLLGLSGWFITAASLAGAAGVAAAVSFNTLLPSACIRLLAILRTGCRYTERLSGHDAAFRALARIRPALFAALAAAPPAQALALSSGEAVARVVQDVDELEQHFARASARWGAVAAAVAGGGVLLLAGVAPAAAVGAVTAAVLVLAWRLSKAFEALGRAVPRANGVLREEFAPLLGATPELRAYGLEDWATTRVCERADTLVTAQRAATRSGGWFEALLAAAGGLIAMLALGLARGVSPTAVSLPIAALAALAAAMVIDGIGGTARAMQRRGRLREAEARLDAMFATVAPSHPIPPVIPAPTITLLDFPATLPAGTMVGLSGPSGSGKTTLMEALLRLRTIRRGCIRLDGIEINDIDSAAVRACFALAPQDAALLAGTVRDNLLIGRDDATEAELWDALRDAALGDRVRQLLHGLDSWLGEGGERLSGGERRRLVLARAYLRDAPWLLLDEPTEGLDRRTEAMVIERLRLRLTRRGQGAILVSHRPAPLAACTMRLTMRARDSLMASA